VRSEAVCISYWNCHEKTKQTIQGNWICTGDKIHQDGEGYYWFDGRADDMLKVSAAWVSPSEIESVLVEHSAVAEVAVVADKDGLEKAGGVGRLASGIQRRCPTCKESAGICGFSSA
jgi:acyl-coenzyme A synthetase/AMP-(fatty) acid ligase